MSRTWTIASNDLRRRVRNRSALVMAVVAPLVMAGVFGLLLGGTDDLEFNMGIVDLDQSDVSRQIVTGLADQPDDSPLVVTTYETEEDATTAVDDGDEGVAIVLPAGLSSAASPGAASIRVLQTPSLPISGQVGASVSNSIAAEFEAVARSLATAAELGVRIDVADVVEGDSRASMTALAVGEGEMDAVAYFGASMSILFMFFTVGFAARSILDEQSGGTLIRVLSTPATPVDVVVGKVLSVSLLAFGGFVVTWVVSTLAFGADWGPPATVLLLIVATVISIGGVSLFVTSFCRTGQQAETVTSVVAFAFALLGGNFLGPGAAPGLLTSARFLTPNGWALAAFTESAADRASMIDVLPAVGALVVIGVVLGAFGVLKIRRSLAW